MWTFKLVALGLCLLVANAALYDNYHVLHLPSVETRAHASVVRDLVRRHQVTRKVQLMQDDVLPTMEADLVVAPELVDEVLRAFEVTGIKVDVIDKNFQTAIDNEKKANDEAIAKYVAAKAKGMDTTPMDHTFYRSNAQILTFLDEKAASSPNAKVFTAGQTHEGRPIKGLEITAAGDRAPKAWLDAGVHAREWIAPATALYIIDQILSGTDADSQFMRETYNWYIVPEVNPDGYEYTDEDRLWRKNRKPSGDGCTGTDCNRNFDFNWGRHGTSTDPCSDTYGGSEAFSEPESVAIRDTVMARSRGMPIFISLHSFSQLWLVPWAGDLSKPSDYPLLKQIGDKAGEAAEAVNGRYFTVGTPPDILYAASGGMYDWGKNKAGAKYAYTPELRPASQLDGGFVIGPENIEPSGQEIFAGIVSTARDVQAQLAKYR